MKPRPIHRSPVFWLGLPGLLFILWTWHDSLTREAGIFRSAWLEGPVHSVGVMDTICYRSAGFHAIYHVIDPGPGESVRHYPIEMWRDDLLPGLLAERASPLLAWKTPDPVFANPRIFIRGVIIPHWLALVLYGVAWGGVIGWRQVRIRRAESATGSAGAVREGM
ncbi:hypothetical protein [Luteolibacter luteus]|uniref:Uncharacterized protein n=1 Tax=Luteolibacter luteus TaxID=2728835 RepID=A0A858RQT9_9BACT|nr:hypothetical protein [Luteolibacter luteus]QJE99115.1 hypothetical protein HHL09_26160 [Luteolibacter luteus]